MRQQNVRYHKRDNFVETSIPPVKTNLLCDYEVYEVHHAKCMKYQKSVACIWIAQFKAGHIPLVLHFLFS